MFGTAFKLEIETGKNTLRLLTSGRKIRGIFQNLSYPQTTIKIHMTMTECPLDDNDYDYNLDRVLHDQTVSMMPLSCNSIQNLTVMFQCEQKCEQEKREQVNKC